MADKILESVMENAAVVVCKHLICKVSSSLSIGLAFLKKSLAVDTGPYARRPESLAVSVEDLIDQLSRILYGKAHIHSVLHGDDEDSQLVEDLYSVLNDLGSSISVPLRNILAKPFVESEVRPKVRALSSEAATLHERVQVILLKASGRLAKATEGLGKTVPGAPVEAKEEDWTVVAIDKAAYSQGAIALESIVSPRALLEHNRAILSLFSDAIAEAGLSPNDVLVHGSGDGALLYFRDPKAAVKVSLSVHEKTREQERQKPTLKYSQGFRIGIATGPVCVACHLFADGNVFKFEAGGVTIINAVRIEAATVARELWICDNTFRGLEELQSKFRDPQQIQTKGHEERTLIVYKYRP